MELVCPKCGKQYEAGKFCLECGTPLQKAVVEMVCPSCGTVVKSGKFCPECGTKLSEQIVARSSNAKRIVQQKYNDKDPIFAKYYDKKGFPRNISPEERSVVIEELKSFADKDIAEAKMLLGFIMLDDGNKETVADALKYISVAEAQGDKLAYYFMSIAYFYGIGVEQNHIEAEKRMLEMYKEFQNGEIAGILAELYATSAYLCDYEKAFEYATIAAEDDEPGGYYILGGLYHNGWGVEVDGLLALENYKMAAAQGHEIAMNQIGNLFMGHAGIEENPEQAFYWFNESSKKGHDVGMYNLGCCYRDGYGVAKDDEEAAVWFKKAAEAGDVSAMIELGSYYQEIIYDTQKAKKWYNKAADLGDAEAQNKLAVILADIDGDYKQSIKWYKKSMEQGNPWAYRNYAWCLFNGNGVKENKGKALEMLQKAIDLGCPDAENDLQEMQNDNVDKTIDDANDLFSAKEYEKAIPIYKEYAEAGNVRAMANYGSCLVNGWGIKQNLKSGVDWLKKAANEKFAFACCRLAEIYGGTTYKGKTYTIDNGMAWKYMKLAEKYGLPEQDMQLLKQKLTPCVEFSDITFKIDVQDQGSLGFEVTGKMSVSGLAGEKVIFCVQSHTKYSSSYQKDLEDPDYILNRYRDEVSPKSISTVIEKYSFFIPYSKILDIKADFDETLYMIVWRKTNNKFTKMLQIEQPFRISCKTHLLRSNEYAFVIKGNPNVKSSVAKKSIIK